MSPSAAPALPPLPARPSAALAAVLGWLVPGLGQAYLGRPAKALLFLLVIGGTYAWGLHLSGYTCVNWDRDPYWFGAQALAGAPTALAAYLTRGLEPSVRIPTYDVGLLYVTVAALLNAVAVADALGTVEERQSLHAAARAQRREAEARAQALAAQETAAREAAEFLAAPYEGELVLPPLSTTFPAPQAPAEAEAAAETTEGRAGELDLPPRPAPPPSEPTS